MTGSIYINSFSCFSCNGLHLVSKEENIKDKQHIKAKLRNLDSLGSEDTTSPSSNSPEYCWLYKPPILVSPAGPSAWLFLTVKISRASSATGQASVGTLRKPSILGHIKVRPRTEGKRIR